MPRNNHTYRFAERNYAKLVRKRQRRADPWVGTCAYQTPAGETVMYLRSYRRAVGTVSEILEGIRANVID